MSEIKQSDSATSEESDEKDWNAAKAFFENLKTNKPRPPKSQYAVTVAVSSRTLFNMVAERKIYEEEGLEKYVAHQVAHESEPLTPGPAFPFIQAMMNVNSRLRALYPDSEELFDIVLMTNNHAQVGVRLINNDVGGAGAESGWCSSHYSVSVSNKCEDRRKGSRGEGVGERMRG
ncbi:cytosolic 5'-nucleotidase 1A-like [Brachionichthys hirsutus]|uniref:cytosolic 5'-nucleotidase 1A-like n=1 Tax=Brachionichthys hirsutus TaxID=412623 RepID=UPI0036053A9A